MWQTPWMLWMFDKCSFNIAITDTNCKDCLLTDC